MSQSTLISPVENMTGKLSSTSDGRVTVTRRKCYGKMLKVGLFMVRWRPMFIIAMRENGRKLQVKIEVFSKKCNCL